MEDPPVASFQWIDADGRFRLAFCGCPLGDVPHTLSQWRDRGVDRIVSLQTEQESAQLGLQTEAALAEARGMVFQRFAIVDHAVPDDATAALALARKTLHHLNEGQGVILHCFAGIGRSGLMAILTLMAAGYDLQDAQNRASLARGISVPEPGLQRRWLQAAQDWLSTEPNGPDPEGSQG